MYVCVCAQVYVLLCSVCVCLQSGGGAMALDTCEATSPLAPVLRGLLSEQTVLGVRDNKEPKVTLLHSPSPSPPEATSFPGWEDHRNTNLGVEPTGFSQRKRHS